MVIIVSKAYKYYCVEKKTLDNAQNKDVNKFTTI